MIAISSRFAWTVPATNGRSSSILFGTSITRPEPSKTRSTTWEFSRNSRTRLSSHVGRFPNERDWYGNGIAEGPSIRPADGGGAAESSVTRLASSGDCRLKAILPPSAYPDWPPSPRLHSTSRPFLDGSRSPRSDSIDEQRCPRIASALDQLLRQEEMRLSRAPIRPIYTDLQAALGPREWLKRRSLAIARTRQVWLLHHAVPGNLSRHRSPVFHWRALCSRETSPHPNFPSNP